MILTCHKEMNEYMGKYLSIHSFSALYGPRILEREHGRQSKILLLESIVLNCCVKVTIADLRNIGLKMRE